ncbi:site-specific integrase [Paenibacillus terrigena]|uniref:site-specific integrase n=1 Tax=Paenibacillus terrigena TaxID=369333 RepID=UPI00035E7C88|nr:site-specific integrase [Paenibacillus terrigena]
MPVHKDEKAKKNPWFFQFYTGEIINGKRERIKKRGFRTKKEADAAMVKAKADLERGEFVKGKKITVAEYMNSWLDNKQDLNAVTRELYESYLRIHIIPDLGHHPIDKLCSMDIQNFISLLRSKGLAENTVKRIFSVINTALNQAFRMELVRRNVASVVSKPKGERRELKVWDLETINRFLEATHDGSRYSIAMYLALMTGMRQGELLGLRWADIDFDNKTIHVQQSLARDGKTINHTLKSKKSIRSVAISTETVARLKEQRKLIVMEMVKEGEDYQKNDLVICSSKGTPASTRSIMKVWNKFIERLELPRITFHDLRHTHASLLLQQGVHPKIVSERLGHSSVVITLDTYSHLLPNLQADAADGLDMLIKSGSEREKEDNRKIGNDLRG